MSGATTYDGLVAVLSGLCVIPATDPNFATELPDAIQYANNRIQRDLDLIFTRTYQGGATFTPGVGVVDFQAGLLEAPIIVLEGVSITTPSGVTTPLTRQTQAYFDVMYPYSTSGVPAPASAWGVPVDYTNLDNTTMFVGPVPNLAYLLNVLGTVRLLPPSTTNETPWILQNLPDLFVTACMVRLSAYMKNYQSAGDDPQQPVNWETQYKALLDGAAVEEARRKAQSSSWSDQKPLQQSTPQRQ